MEVQNPVPQKSTFLKVMGIIMIVGGILGIILAVVGILGVGALAAIAVASGVEISSGLLIVSGILAIVGAIVELIAGINGVKNCDKPQLAQKCVVLGIAIIGISIVSNVLTLIAYAESFSIFSVLLSLVVPVLYVVAALQLKKAA